MPYKHLHMLFRWNQALIGLTKGADIRQEATWSHTGCISVYTLPASTPLPDPLSSPSGILLFYWWKRLLGSWTNELPLLLNDVCKLWPSLLQVNSAETQSLHHQLEAPNNCQQLVGLKWFLDGVLRAKENLFVAHWRSLVVEKYIVSQVFTLKNYYW